MEKSLLKLKEFEVIYKFADVVETIEAETQEEAEQIANDRAYYGKSKEEDRITSTECYEIEVEEVKE